MNEHGRGLGATAEASDKGSEGWKTDEGTRAGPAVEDEPGAACERKPGPGSGATGLSVGGWRRGRGDTWDGRTRRRTGPG